MFLMLTRESEHVYAVHIYQLEISVPVSEYLFFYFAYEADKSKSIPICTYAATKQFYFFFVNLAFLESFGTFIYLSILHMLSTHTNNIQYIKGTSDCCINLTYVELNRDIFSTSCIPDLFTNGVTQGDANEILHFFFLRERM